MDIDSADIISIAPTLISANPTPSILTSCFSSIALSSNNPEFDKDSITHRSFAPSRADPSEDRSLENSIDDVHGYYSKGFYKVGSSDKDGSSQDYMDLSSGNVVYDSRIDAFSYCEELNAARQSDEAGNQEMTSSIRPKGLLMKL